MNTRRFTLWLIVIVCLILIAAIFIHSRELGFLRQKHRDLQAQEVAAATESERVTVLSNSDAQTPSAELLQLRNQVGQLTERQRELTGATAENERLQAQVAERKAKGDEGIPLPPDYIRRNQAQWQGLSTPENTIQSLLWSMEHHDVTNLLQVLTPQSAEELARQFGGSLEKFFEHTSSFPGMRIIRQEQMPDGSMKLEVEFVPGKPLRDRLTLQRVGTDWRLKFP